MRPLIALGTAFLAAAAIVAALTLPGSTANAATQNVTVSDTLAFIDATSSTGTTTITAGDTVHWTWTGSLPHSVTADDGSFDSAVHSGGSFPFDQPFNTPGSYAYHCQIHGGAGGVGMSGTIVVQAAATPTNTAAAPTSTAAATNTTAAGATNTPATSATAGASSTSAPATSTPVAAATQATISASPTRAAAAAAAGTQLPRTGNGSEASRGSVWLAIALVALGLATFAVAAAMRVRRQA